MKDRKLPSFNIGTVTLLMTFISLCLVVFSVISLSASLREYNYSTKLINSNTAYINAVSEANQRVSQCEKSDEFTVNIDDNYVLRVSCTVDSMGNKKVSYNKCFLGQWTGDEHINVMTKE